ncbi:MAG: DUF177 domain-containing protein [Burkholderiaceae bacterium]
MATPEFDPRALGVEAFAKQAGELAGRLALDDLERLAEMQLPDSAQTASPRIEWTARGEARPVRGGPAEVWLHLSAQVPMTLQCQRCLEGVRADVRASRSFLFVHGEAQAAALDEETEDDVLPLTRSLDLRLLVEDELLLALPLVPRHLPTCPQPLPAPAEGAVEEAAASPFAALAVLKRDGPLN